MKETIKARKLRQGDEIMFEGHVAEITGNPIKMASGQILLTLTIDDLEEVRSGVRFDQFQDVELA